jgi:hypothetical protein
MEKVREIEGEIRSGLDRFAEAHFWIHALEQFYHYADPFRWHLNAFLKAIKEVPTMLKMELQNQKGFPAWFEGETERLRENQLLRSLSKHRDFVVHRGMLVPKSHGGIGVTESRGFNAGITLPIDPLMDSDEAMRRYIFVISSGGKDPLDLLREDEESLPCVQRVWKLDAFEKEIVELAAKAWLQTGETVGNAVRWLGGEPPNLQLTCRHSAQEVQYKMYDRKELKRDLKEVREARRKHGS